MKAERKQRIREALRSVRLHALTAAAACFFATATTGCVSHHGDNAVIESHFTRLEQTCFGYEPTVWRTMSGPCETAVRQIPEPMIQVPKASESTTETVTTPETAPKESPLETVPEPGQGSGPPGLFRELMAPPGSSNEGSVPPTEPVPGTGPMDESAPAKEPVPGVEPGTEPAEENAPAEPPATEPAPTEPATDEPTSSEPTAEPAPEPELAPVPEAAQPESTPAVPPSAEPSTAPPPVPQFSFSSARTNKTAPADTLDNPESTQARKGAANELFRSLESALGDDAQPPARNAKAAPKKGPTGLAKFISY